jgi:hypothetical protein
MTEISMKPLKEKALKLPEPVKSLILSEPDTLDSKEYISKICTWERILDLSREVSK